MIDPLGRKLGKDPITGIEYNEIPNAWYFEDGFDDPTGETPPSQERNKLIQILEPIDGEYHIQVIGTDTGSYTMSLSFYDETGESKNITKEDETTTDNIQEFTLDYSTETVEEVEFHKIVEIDIKPGSDPNSINQKWCQVYFYAKIIVYGKTTQNYCSKFAFSYFKSWQ